MLEEAVARVVLGALAIGLFYNEHVLYRRPVVRSRIRWNIRNVDFWLFIVAWLGVFILLLYLTGMGAEYLTPTLPSWMRWVGIVIGSTMMLSCVPLSRRAHAAIGSNFSTNLELHSNHQLVRTGPYRLVRHPIYLGLLLCVFGACFITVYYPIMALTLATVVVLLRRMQKEEAMLIERYSEYREYKKNTGKLFPKWL